MKGLRAGADVIMDPVAVEGMISAAEDGARVVWITGERLSDDAGRFYRITGRGDTRVGMSVVCEDGGTTPEEDVISEFGRSFTDGVLVVVDPYAGEFAVYVYEGGAVRKAAAVMSE